MKHLTLIKVRTADPTWLLHNISVYKSRPWKIKNWDQFLEILVSPCLSLSLTLVESPSGAWNPPCLLILPGLLRSDRGGLSVSSPSGEREDACGLRRWSKFPALEFYSASFLHWISSLSYPYFTTLYILNKRLIKQLFPDFRRHHPRFEFPGSSGAGPWQYSMATQSTWSLRCGILVIQAWESPWNALKLSFIICIMGTALHI